ncbi:hypothetical protein PROFUN_14517 [Planoprotostelium fungivorum]|uniref:Phosphatidylethanolamine N-methyltransferase n=1 Tax=Planoprotostelium fungivorum TaxID=1890364 RepID=A0A2P6MZR1_9EUKA|nr:hypothetical protein PROFUN_14517 [Planoprotostelium fungivorum]
MYRIVTQEDTRGSIGILNGLHQKEGRGWISFSDQSNTNPTWFPQLRSLEETETDPTTLTTSMMIDFTQTSFYVVTLASFLNVFLWNIIARAEYRTHFLTRLAGGPYRGCYALALTIFLAGLYRERLFLQALDDQPTLELLSHPSIVALSYLIFTAGSVLVGATYLRLGITGTYLGDYFGILMDEKVEGFPFNVMANPMYNGSTLTFIALSLWHKSPAGLLISLWIFIVYRGGIHFEEPFTNHIYAQREEKRAREKLQKKQ